MTASKGSVGRIFSRVGQELVLALKIPNSFPIYVLSSRNELVPSLTTNTTPGISKLFFFTIIETILKYPTLLSTFLAIVITKNEKKWNMIKKIFFTIALVYHPFFFFWAHSHFIMQYIFTFSTSDCGTHGLLQIIHNFALPWSNRLFCYCYWNLLFVCPFAKRWWDLASHWVVQTIINTGHPHHSLSVNNPFSFCHWEFFGSD